MTNISPTWLRKAGLKLGHLNIYHILNKLPQLAEFINDFHIFGFSESRLKETISTEEIIINGFDFFRRDPMRNLDTGIIVYTKTSLSVTRKMDLEIPDVECIWLEVRLPKIAPINIGYIYRNPSECADWFDCFYIHDG